MRVLKWPTFLLICVSSFSGFSQIELGGEEPKKTKKEKKSDSGKKLRRTEEKEKLKKRVTLSESTSNVEAYFITNWSSTSRLLRENEGLFSEPLGERANETGLSAWSFGLGIRNQFMEHFALQVGISYMRNGENYSFEATDSDSTFKYQTTYSYIGMPIKGLFTYGKNVKLLAGGGLTPQLFTGYRQEQEWTTSLNARGNETIKRKNGFNNFVLSAALNLGVQLEFGGAWSVVFMPEYRIQLTNSYEKTDPHEHFARALGFDVGLTVKL